MNDHDIVYEIVYIDNNITAKINKPPQRKKILVKLQTTVHWER